MNADYLISHELYISVFTCWVWRKDSCNVRKRADAAIKVRTYNDREGRNMRSVSRQSKCCQKAEPIVVLKCQSRALRHSTTNTHISVVLLVLSARFICMRIMTITTTLKRIPLHRSQLIDVRIVCLFGFFFSYHCLRCSFYPMPLYCSNTLCMQRWLSCLFFYFCCNGQQHTSLTLFWAHSGEQM